jgi:hypothetical protein
MWSVGRCAGLALTLCWIALCGAAAQGQTANVSVEVTGAGSSYDEAKSDAIRAALQSCVKQLVVADRVVNNESVVLDRVLSTMNGFVEKYEEKSVRKDDQGVTVQAEITISASRIENFVGFTTGPQGQINGGGMFAEANRRTAQTQAEDLQSEARGEIFDRLYRGFPTEALEIKPVAVSPGLFSSVDFEGRLGIPGGENV